MDLSVVHSDMVLVPGRLSRLCCGAMIAWGEGGLREGCARGGFKAVEVIEVAKAGLDHGEQTLAIFRQKALLRLASIEGRKLLRQPPRRASVWSWVGK